MPSERDLHLNSVARFSKVSPRLHLEEHSHCEVPAGCGGVVMRWYDPARGVPVLLWAYTTHPARYFVNGVEPTSVRPLVPPGEVVLAIECAPTQQLGLLFAAVRPRDGRHDVEEGTRPLVVTAADGTWRCATVPPPEGWMLPGFDAGAWPTLVEREMPPPAKENSPGQHRHERLLALGARPLGLADAPGPAIWKKLAAAVTRPHAQERRVWVRKVFTVPSETQP